MAQGQIRKALSGFYYVYSDQQTFQTRGRGNFRKRQLTPLVGDYVEFESTNQTEGYVLKLLPRKNALVRPQVVNVDQAVVVTSCVKPDFSSNLLDRFLMTLEKKKIRPLIYFTKGDLLDEAARAKLAPIVAYYQQLGYPTFFDAEPFAPAQVKQLTTYFADQLTVFMGQSGAGKSTLLNHIDPELQLKTAAVSESLSRGKHTTRHVELLPLFGGLVADTPGFSSLNLSEFELTELPLLFPEFVAASAECRFRACQHDQEPGCAVKQQVETGQILASRYANYLQFRTEKKAEKPKYNGKRGKK
ncbi:ribosome small subunit-dependent GTPase A [Loigolactobacillus coryniformis]|uniref:Small ribosomal subunit biogenesis GTPase RsgA n=4 Tax=Loigolactobacillus coryniformis TaxID=1610 RepID=J2Z7J2_9LACO|nr:ribosome small subunit-dependent GTPase A [Loigolactobacillus coryniformis]MDT3391041.1 ribosome small subunit-dependent GTPase A [Bacillota bacterium]OEH90436.1 GTPase RsgA [Loigolactobacillus coryniformis subsp. coryniformis]RRG05870.1 MAG: ribosome small subunit-dependent GTPase A [Lactobacillus sp.]ATO43979.1 ribosome small subunit-dependent GTPase A [Loigolactobacillus coryniformis subsp. torquens DSM 20004 = KCTC 3535]ATO55653.1 ribosome small subunit-dependent GTPase A [Loigolactobac